MLARCPLAAAKDALRLGELALRPCDSRCLRRPSLAHGVVPHCCCAAGASPRAASSSAASWLQGAPPKVDVDAGTLAAFYYRAVREFDTPTKDCVVAGAQDEKMNHGQFDKQVYAYAVGLIDALGVQPGSKVALWMNNDLESAVLQYAVTLVGAVAVLVDVRCDFDAVLKVVGEEGVRVLIMAPRHGLENRAAKLHDVFADELAWAKQEAGYEPLHSKRFRSLKFIVSTGGEAVDGVVRLKDVPVYGTGEGARTRGRGNGGSVCGV